MFVSAVLDWRYALETPARPGKGATMTDTTGQLQGWTRTDEKVGDYTLRTALFDGKHHRSTVYSPSGWRVGIYKTDAGARRAIDRHMADDKARALPEYIALVQAIGSGFHPDTRGADYDSLPAAYNPILVDRIVTAAFDVCDPYVVALDVLDGGDGTNKAADAPKPVHDHSHRAYAPDYCPLCGTARVIGGGN